MKKMIFGFLIIFISMLVVAFCSYPYLPETIPIHWSLDGPNTFGSRHHIFFYPCMLMLLNAMMFLLPYLDPKKENYVKFNKTYNNLFWLLNCSFIAFFIVILFAIFNPEKADINLLIQVIVGVLIIFMGNMMPRVRQNFFVGIKTPWVYADERIWEKTHRFSGRLWFAGGFLLILIAFIPSVSLWGNLMIFIVLAFVPIIYSFIVYKKIKQKGENR